MNTQISSIVINAPATRVWEALTKPELVKKWQYDTDVTTDWQKDSPIVFRNEIQGALYEQKGTILEVEPPKLLKYSLFAPRPGLEDKPENYFIMTYALKETNGKTELTITQEDPREQPPQGHPQEEENSILKGLKILVEQS